MRDRCLHRAVRHPVGDGLLHVGKPHIDDVSAKRTHRLDRLTQHLLGRNVHAVAAPLRVEANPQASYIQIRRSQIVGHRIEDRGRIGMIASGDDAEHRAGIRRAPGNDPDMVQRRCQFEHAVAADASPTWLQPGQAVGGAGPADRSTGIGGERAVAKPRRSCDRRAT